MALEFTYFEGDGLVIVKLEMCCDPIIVAPADPTLPHWAVSLKGRVGCIDLLKGERQKVNTDDNFYSKYKG